LTPRLHPSVKAVIPMGTRGKIRARGKGQNKRAAFAPRPPAKKQVPKTLHSFWGLAAGGIWGLVKMDDTDRLLQLGYEADGTTAAPDESESRPQGAVTALLPKGQPPAKNISERRTPAA